MNVVFRTDSSAKIGSGHVMRCLTLASALKQNEVKVFFICRDHQGNLCDLIRNHGFDVVVLPAALKGIQDQDFLDSSTWLGVPWQEDARQTENAFESLEIKPDLIVMDHYSIDHHWESAMRSTTGRLMVIDDLADRAHDCDLLLDQNLIAKMNTRYNGLVSKGCEMLLGPEYSLLQPIYGELQKGLSARKGPVKRILVFFGELGEKNLTGLTLSALERLNYQDIHIDVVIGSNNPHTKAIREQVESHENFHLHNNLPTLAPLMAKADLAVGASGATSWERLCLGLPAIVVSLADNQRGIAEELNRRGLVQWLGHQKSVDEDVLARALGNLIEKGLDEEWSQRCRNTVDGRGVNRVCSALSMAANH
jgi:UDP-2,4-diacetamido-2,4,6-trideoxy-beta-L-altropyranose hydrolase